MKYENSLVFATEQDAADPLKSYRELFYFPNMHDREVVYFTGNSLGLQPKRTQDYILNELEDWATFGVEGQLYARKPWDTYQKQFAQPVAKLVGAKTSEIAVMNQFAANLHLLLLSFYHPDKKRYKILCEAPPFSSNSQALESLVHFQGLNPDEVLISVAPRKGEHCIRQEDLLEAIEKNKDTLALVMIAGVNHFNGQAFDIETLTAAAHRAGAVSGFDLTHAAGNIELELHNWQVDFACWGTGNYLNSGPGGISGTFIHERHSKDPIVAHFFGLDNKSMPTAPILSLAAHKSAVDLFDEIGMSALTHKSRKLTGYLEFIIEELNNNGTHELEIITPRGEKQRGCQLSIIAHNSGKELSSKLIQAGVIVDWLEPHVIRCAPVPMYNSFEDVFRFGEIINKI